MTHLLILTDIITPISTVKILISTLIYRLFHSLWILLPQELKFDEYFILEFDQIVFDKMHLQIGSSHKYFGTKYDYLTILFHISFQRVGFLWYFNVSKNVFHVVLFCVCLSKDKIPTHLTTTRREKMFSLNNLLKWAFI